MMAAIQTIKKIKYKRGTEVVETGIFSYTGWNDKIVALEKTIWFHFRLMETGFLFLLQTIN